MTTTTMDLAKERSALIYKIIEEIRSFPAIWDVSCKGYKDNYVRNEAYNAVANEMNMTVHQVKERYRNLRTYYGREKKKIEKSERNGDGHSEVYRSKWEYFDVLDSFLKDSLRGRQSSSWYSTEWSPGDDEEGESLGDISYCEENTDLTLLARKRLKVEHEDDESWEGKSDLLREPMSPPVRQEVHVSPQPIALHSNSSAVGQIVPRRAESAQETQSRSTNMDHSGILADRAQRQVKPVLAQTLSQSTRVGTSLAHGTQPNLPSLDSLFGQMVGMQLANVQNGKKKEFLKLKIQRLIFEAQFDIDPCTVD
ncbi:uncharacterized protein LOC135468431 [Liolophura sinensis]|uniref:uncharacterized protein LOC135468431 n=1 Tax=Liolophura sinensis TaxID=3198878 RepID=UPI0031591660